ncbi:MAG: hypothetical protein ABI539_14180 [Acidobacteriota bacterium]
MNRPLTVYFDTSFYINLASASPDQAEEVIREINKLSIRHVLSGQIVQELLSNASKPQKDKTLVSRVKQFQLEPLRISSSNLESPVSSEELNWDVLLLDGNDRKSVASFFKSIFDLQTEAESWSKIARNPKEVGNDPRVQANIEGILNTMGIENIEEFQSERGINKMIALWNDMFELLSKLPNLPRTQFNPIAPVDSTDSVELQDISGEIFNQIGEEFLAKIKDKDGIVDSTTATDGRPHKVVATAATTDEKRRLGTTLRDSNNMSLFAVHREEIDLLQIDNAQMAMVQNQRVPVHKLVELGLNRRCFSSSGLVDTVEAVKLKVVELGL